MPTGAFQYPTRSRACRRRTFDLRRPPRYASLVLIALALAALVPRALAAQTGSAREYEIKAAFLFNFGQFVTWSPEAQPLRDAPFVICVLGADPFGRTLDRVAEGATIQDRPVRIERHASVEDAGGCQVLYVSESEERRLSYIMDRLADRGILTVGEGDAFIEESGMIRFRIVQNRVRLEINLAAAEDAGLTISSRLLSLATVVRREED